MDPLQTRALTYFLTLAEELHFGRAAARLGIAQPSLSRSIRNLEAQLGVTLLERTSRRVRLTSAGEVLRDEGRRALEAMAAAAHRAQRAGRPDPGLTLVMKPGGDGGLLPAILAAYESRPGTPPVNVIVCAIHERAPMLRDGRADVGLLHSPSPHCDLRGLDSEELLVERQVVVVGARHRLAQRSSVRLADLAGETLATHEPTAAGGAGVRDIGQLTQLIALERAVTLAPESVRGQLRPDLVCVPVLDAPLISVLLAWPQQHRSLAVAELIRTAVDVAEGHRAQPQTLSIP